MIDDLAKLLDRVSAPADLAVILLLGPLAYGLDAGLDVIGFLAPSYVAIGAACIGLGVKKVIDIRLAARGEQRALQAGRDHLTTRAKALEERMAVDHAPAALVERLTNERALHSIGITTDEQLEDALGECLTEYRSWLRTTIDSGVWHPRG